MHAVLKTLTLRILFLGLAPLAHGVAVGDQVCPSQDALKPPWLEEQFVIRFFEYREASYWRHELEEWLKGSRYQWRWIERFNPASIFPTDFGVITLSLKSAEMAKARIEDAAFVKDVHHDRAIRRIVGVDPVQKPPGRLRTRSTFGLDRDDDEYMYEDATLPDGELKRRLHVSTRHKSKSVTELFRSGEIWKLGYTGQNIKVGVFDTGIKKDHPHVKKIKERTNWTSQNTVSDGLGHGSFVAGVISGTSTECPGFAPDVELYTFKVFTDDQISYTSWFMDAFNYAIMLKLDVVNLSIGGPDYLDHPFVEKVLDVTSSGIIMVSAIGNDGPLYGTLNNPADQNDVIGIGGIDFSDRVARFSSRGMSNWELPTGYGRVKPDVMAYAQDVSGSRIDNGCRRLSGTSVASPVAAGIVALLMSTVPNDKRSKMLNPASMKQALVEAAVPVDNVSIYVQGAGKIDLIQSMKILQEYTPRASFIPGKIDLTDCPYMKPLCQQPLYANAAPLIINGTILNGLAVAGFVKEKPVYTPVNKAGHLISMEFEYSDVLWPWSGYLAIYIRVLPTGNDFNGVAEGTINFTVASNPKRGETEMRSSTVSIPFRANIIPTPVRKKRILWDQFHSIKYPPAYIPRDNLDNTQDILDWHGDHLHTNYYDLLLFLIDAGYYVEILGSPLTCFDAEQYGTLMIVDSEDTFYPEEVSKLEKDVKEKGLGLIVFAEWYDVQTAVSSKFFDDNTRNWWKPVTGGGHVPGLNTLLSPYGIAFGDAVLKGRNDFTTWYKINYSSGTNIARFPAEGYLLGFLMKNVAAESEGEEKYYIFGLADQEKGRVAVYGDSNCLDADYRIHDCFDLLKAMIDYVNRERPSELLERLLAAENKLSMDYDSEKELPDVIDADSFEKASFVLSHPHRCYKNSPHGEAAQNGKKKKAPGAQTPTAAQKRGEKTDAGRGVNEVAKLLYQNPDVQSTDKLTPNTAYKETTDGGEWRHLGSEQLFGYHGELGESPPLVFTKWSAALGLLIVFILYRVARRRRRIPQQQQHHT